MENVLKENNSIMKDLQEENDQLQTISDRQEKSEKAVNTTQEEVQTDLVGDEIKMIAEMLSQKEIESGKTSSELKKNKVYTKLCENKIRNLENTLKKNYLVQIDKSLVEEIKSQAAHASLDPNESGNEKQCVMIINQKWFTKPQNTHNHIGTLKATLNGYHSVYEREKSPDCLISDPLDTYNTQGNLFSHTEENMLLKSKSQPDSLGLTFNKNSLSPSSSPAQEYSSLQQQICNLKQENSALKQEKQEIVEVYEALKEKYSHLENTEGDAKKLSEEVKSKDIYIESLKSTIDDLKKSTPKHNVANSESKEIFSSQKPLKHPSMSVSGQKRKTWMEGTCDSNNIHRERSVDSDRIPTFSHNCFTEEDEGKTNLLSTLGKNGSTQDEVSDLRAQVSQKEQQIEQKDKKIHNLKGSLDARDQQILNLEQSLAQARSKANTAVVSGGQSEQIDLVIENSSLQSKISQYEERTQSLLERIDEIEMEKENIQKDFLNLNSEVDEITQKFDEYQQDITEMEGLLGQKESVIQEMQYQLQHYNSVFRKDQSHFLAQSLASSSQKCVKSAYTYPIETAVNKLTTRLYNSNFSSTQILSSIKELTERVKNIDTHLLSSLCHPEISQTASYKSQRLGQLTSIQREIHKIRTDYYTQQISKLQSQVKRLEEKLYSQQIFRALASVETSSLEENENINSGVAKVKIAQLEAAVKALRNKLEVQESSKQRLQIQEISKIQQRTIQEMHTLNEQAIISGNQNFKNFAGLDLGQEIGSLKLKLNESQKELEIKNFENQKLTTDLEICENKLKEICQNVEDLNILPSIDQLEKIHQRNSAKLYGEKSNLKTQDGDKKFQEKLNNVLELLENIQQSVTSSHENTQKIPTSEVEQAYNELAKLKSEKDLEICEIKEQYEQEIDHIKSAKIQVEHQEGLSQDLENLQIENSDLSGQIQSLNSENASLTKSITLLKSTISDLTSADADLNLNKIMDKQNTKNCLELNNFKIVPSKIISALVAFKKKQLQAEAKGKFSGTRVDEVDMQEQNEMLEELMEANNRILQLEGDDDLELSPIPEHQEYDNKEAQIKRLNQQRYSIQAKILEICGVEVEENKDAFGETDGSEKFDQDLWTPFIESIIFLASKVAQFESRSSSDSKEPGSIEQAQRVAIKSLTSTLTRLISENDLEDLSFQTFTPTREEDRTIWYLDLLEAQLKLSKDLVSDLQEYQESIRDSEGYQDTKQLKATYYELASNTNFASSQISAVCNIFHLVKADLVGKGTNIPGLDAQDLSAPCGMISSDLVREIETLKNDLNLTTKVKNSLESQLEIYKKQEEKLKVNEMESLEVAEIQHKKLLVENQKIESLTQELET